MGKDTTTHSEVGTRRRKPLRFTYRNRFLYWTKNIRHSKVEVGTAIKQTAIGTARTENGEAKNDSASRRTARNSKTNIHLNASKRKQQHLSKSVR